MRDDELINNLRSMAKIFPDYAPTLEQSAERLHLMKVDLDVTNKSADFHMKECQRLRGELEEAKKGYKEISAVLEEIRQDAIERDTLE